MSPELYRAIWRMVWLGRAIATVERYAGGVQIDPVTLRFVEE